MEGLLLLAWLLFGSGKKKAPPAELLKPSPLPTPSKSSATVLPSTTEVPSKAGGNMLGPAWKKRCTDLVARSKSGAKWTPMLAKTIGTQLADAAARWVGIESGGNPRTVTTLGERGLAQGMKDAYSTADWAALGNPKTSDQTHADLATKLMARDVKVMGLLLDSQSVIGMAHLYHGLPLMVKELRAQGLLKSTVAETLALALGGYKPSAKVVSYVGDPKWKVTGSAVQDLIVRFFAPAAVIAYGEASIGLLDTLAKEGVRL